MAVAQQEQARAQHVTDQQLIIIQQQQEQVAAEEEARRLEEERQRKLAAKKEQSVKKNVVKKKIFLSSSLTDLHALRLRLEGAEATLSQHVHICLGDDGMHDCGLKITELEVESLTETLAGCRTCSHRTQTEFQKTFRLTYNNITSM